MDKDKIKPIIHTQLIKIYAPPEHVVEHGLGQDMNGAWLDGLYGKQTGYVLLKTLQGCNAFVFKKELDGGILPVVVKP